MDADDLYRLPPEEFVAARNEAAKQARAGGDKEAADALKALRRPSVSAWLVNTLARREPDLLEQLLALGPALREAQAKGRGEELRRLGAQRRELLDEVTERAVELGGRDVTAAVREEVTSTLEAALAHAESAGAVRSGRLVRGLSYVGFGGVDLSGAVAAPSARPAVPGPERERRPAAKRTPRKPAEERRDRAEQERAERIAAAEAAALEAAGRLDDAVRAAEGAERERAAAEAQAEQAHAEVDRLRRELQQAEQAAREADAERRRTTRTSERAVATVRRAQSAEEKARKELDRLRRGS